MEKVREKLYPGHDPYANVDVIPVNIHGWSSDDPIFNEMITYAKPNLIVEVGTWLGGSAKTMASCCLAQNIKDFEIVCVDTFLGSVEHWDRTSYSMSFKNGRPINYDQFLSNMISCNLQEYVTPFPVDSQNGFLVLEKFNVHPDIVYIDAGHDYHSVRNDLVNFGKLLRSGGVLIGDDWHHGPIQQAAFDTFGADKVVAKGAKFIWIK